MLERCCGVPMVANEGRASTGDSPAAADGRLRLAAGRNLAFRTYGPPGGRPILYVHGFASSRLEPAMAAELLPRFGARIVAFDRPGYGGSDPLPEGDVRATACYLLDGMTQLGLERAAL